MYITCISLVHHVFYMDIKDEASWRSFGCLNWLDMTHSSLSRVASSLFGMFSLLFFFRILSDEQFFWNQNVVNIMLCSIVVCPPFWKFWFIRISSPRRRQCRLVYSGSQNIYLARRFDSIFFFWFLWTPLLLIL